MVAAGTPFATYLGVAQGRGYRGQNDYKEMNITTTIKKTGGYYATDYEF